MNHSLLSLAVSLGVLGFTWAPAAKASDWDHRTVVTFQAPVEIPNPSVESGSMVLAPGTYVMKLADLPSNRDVVQFFDRKETHIYSTALAIPDYREQTPDHTIITFEERAAGAPQAMKEWFYPGDNFGENFVYNKPHLAPAAQTSSLGERPTLPAAAPAPEHRAEARPPARAPVTVTPAPQAPQPVVTAQITPPPAPAKPAEPVKKELPKTASDLPLIAVLGMLSLGAGTVLKKKRTS